MMENTKTFRHGEARSQPCLSILSPLLTLVPGGEVSDEVPVKTSGIDKLRDKVYHCPACGRAGFGNFLITNPVPEDPREVALCALMAIEEHDRNLTLPMRNKIGEVLRILKYSIQHDEKIKAARSG